MEPLESPRPNRSDAFPFPTEGWTLLAAKSLTTALTVDQHRSAVSKSALCSARSRRAGEPDYGRPAEIQPLPAFEFTGEATAAHPEVGGEGRLRKTGEPSPVTIVFVQHHGRMIPLGVHRRAAPLAQPCGEPGLAQLVRADITPAVTTDAALQTQPYPRNDSRTRRSALSTFMSTKLR